MRPTASSQSSSPLKITAATKLYVAEFPALFGSLPTSLFTLITVMTLEGWVDGVVKLVMEKFPYAWAFFITYIIIWTFMVLNLFSVVVNATQDVTAKAVAAERATEREMIEQETEPLLAELRRLRAEIAELRTEIGKRLPGWRSEAAVGHRVISRRCSNSVAFGAKRTFSEPRLQNRIYEYTALAVGVR
jgi:hypothetical protein